MVTGPANLAVVLAQPIRATARRTILIQQVTFKDYYEDIALLAISGDEWRPPPERRCN